MSLYQSLLGDDWFALDESVREFLNAPLSQWNATFRVSNGDWIISRIVARLLRLPKAGKGLPVLITRRTSRNGEEWIRKFPDVMLNSIQSEHDGHLREQMGIVACVFRLRVAGGCLMFQHTGTQFVFGKIRIRIPNIMAPVVQGYIEPVAALSEITPESAKQPQDSNSTFVQVSLWLPIVRVVLSYSGLVRGA
ncbi:MAG: DUF4166 domain-containing protein [bacterium]|nr:DUF4166 domain-containing protein [bacterium]